MNDMTRTDMAVLREQLEALVQRLNSSLPINLSETSNSAKKFIYEHPMLSLMLIILTIMCTIPIISFLCFIIATLCFTFLGFIFVEAVLRRRVSMLPTVREEEEGLMGERSVVTYQPNSSTNSTNALQRRTVASRTLTSTHTLRLHRPQQQQQRLRLCKAKVTLSLSCYVVTGGTLFTVGTFFLSGVLFIIALFALGFSAVVGVSWVFVNKALKVLNNVSHKLAPKPLPSPPQERNLGTVD